MRRTVSMTRSSSVPHLYKHRSAAVPSGISSAARMPYGFQGWRHAVLAAMLPDTTRILLYPPRSNMATW